MPVSTTYAQVPSPAVSSYLYVVPFVSLLEMRDRPHGASSCVTIALEWNLVDFSIYSIYVSMLVIGKEANLEYNGAPG
jgi:hypothetical protein